jgi:hypothetical protein
VPGYSSVGELSVGEVPYVVGAFVLVPVAAVAAALHAPAVAGGADVVLPAIAITATAELPQPAGGALLAAPVGLSALVQVEVPMPAAGGGPNLSDAVAAEVSLAVPAVRGGALVSALAVAADVAALPPQVWGGASVTALPLELASYVLAPQIAGGARVRAENTTIFLTLGGSVGGSSVGESSLGSGPEEARTYEKPMRSVVIFEDPALTAGGYFTPPVIGIDVSFIKPSVSARPRRVRITTVARTYNG